MRRFAALALGSVTALAFGSVAALTACASPSAGDWTGGPATPSPIPITANPSARPVGDTMPTGIVVQDQELVLYFWGSRDRPNLDYAWRDTGSGRVDLNPRFPALWIPGSGGAFFGMSQVLAGDGDLVEFGALRAVASRITCQDGGATVEARYTPWTARPEFTVFWLRRHGKPAPSVSPVGEGRWEPLAPERYPLLTAYGPDGKVIATDRLRPPGVEQKGG
jgi:hypothetical protein